MENRTNQEGKPSGEIRKEPFSKGSQPLLSALSKTAREKPPASPPAFAGRAVFALFCLALMVFVIATRLLHLGDKPFHHDESLFAFYAWQQASTGNYDAGGYTPGVLGEESFNLDNAHRPYTHHPLLHGPLQIQLTAYIFRAAKLAGRLGNGDGAARLLAALSGIGLFFLLLRMKPDLGSEGRLFALAALAVSPGIWYYSRFCRNEGPFLLTTLGWVWVLARAVRYGEREMNEGCVKFSPFSATASRFIVLACLLSAILVALKENSLFLFFDAATFLALLFCFDLFGPPASPEGPSFEALHPVDSRGYATTALGLLLRFRYAWIGGLALAWLLLEAVYTNLFFWDTSFVSLYLDTMHYWAGQHMERRLYGEYHYYLPIFALYEPLVLGFLIAACLGMFLKIRHVIAAALLLLALVLGVYIGTFGDSFLRYLFPASSSAFALDTLRPRGVLEFLHMTRPWHLGMAFGVGWITLCGAWFSLRRRKRFRAWLIWWTGLSFLQYSYAGEKVPWVSVHMILPAILLASDLAGEKWREAFRKRRRSKRLLAYAIVALWCLGCLANALQGYRLCFQNPTNPGELLVFNHTQPPVAAMGHLMREATDASNTGPRPILQGEAVWPLVWYLHDREYSFLPDQESSDESDAAMPNLENANMIACNIDFPETHPDVATYFEFERIPLRQAWIPQTLHVLTPLSASMKIWFSDKKEVPLQEEWDDSDWKFFYSQEKYYGLGAWRTLIRYAINRRPWGDPEVTARPEDIYFGKPRALEKAPEEEFDE